MTSVVWLIQVIDGLETVIASAAAPARASRRRLGNGMDFVVPEAGRKAVQRDKDHVLIGRFGLGLGAAGSAALATKADNIKTPLLSKHRVFFTCGLLDRRTSGRGKGKASILILEE